MVLELVLLYIVKTHGLNIPWNISYAMGLGIIA